MPLTMAWAIGTTAEANGLSSHVWISETAVTRLPEGELRDVLERDDLRTCLVNGTMFPDGGYAVNDDYGEMAHWEPLQTAYLDWIRAKFPDPTSDDALPHTVFLLGMASHGMADQTFDSMYMERAHVYDAASDWGTSMDEATDVTFMSEVGARALPERWGPYDELVPLFAALGHEVDASTLERGHALTHVAVGWVGLASQNADTVSAYRTAWPWATAHMTDAAVYGSPTHEADCVAAYWQVLWARLHGDVVTEPSLLASYPRDGAYGHPRAGGDVESRIAAVHVRGLDEAELDPALLHVVGPDGDVAIESDVFYGFSAHVLLLKPVDDLAEEAEYVVTIDDGVPTWDAGELPGSTFSFSTGPPPEPERWVGGGCVGGGNASALFVLLWRRRCRT